MQRFATIAGITSLLMMMAVMPWWNQGMSLASFGIMGAWLLHRIHDTRAGIPLKKQWPDKHLLLFAALFALPLYGLIFTQNFSYAGWDLRMKLPLLLMPIGLAGLNGITPAVQRAAWWTFIASCSIAALICTLVYTGHYNAFAPTFGWKPHTVNDGRDASIFISHIRFGLMLVLCICALVWMRSLNISLVIVRSIWIVALIAFLWLMQSVTSFALLAVLALFFALRILFTTTSPRTKVAAIVGLAATLLVPSLYVYQKAQTYFHVDETERNAHLEAYTSRGEAYVHFPENTLVENGHYVLRYIAWSELKETWNARSSYPFDSTDALGNPIKGTLVRYLTSLGLRKDADGVNRLEQADIQHIENGITNAERLKMNGLDKRLERLFFEWNSFQNNANPNGHSMIQRWLFWKSAWNIWQQQPWTGTGTGDVQDAFNHYYTSTHSLLEDKNRLRAHNQFITMLLTYGIPGFAFFCWIWWKLWKRSYKAPVAACVLLIVVGSFTTEDTLETQAGVAFTAAFIVLTMLQPTGGALFPAEFPSRRLSRDATQP